MAGGSQSKDRESSERRERTEWVSVVIRNEGLNGVAEGFLRQGSRIAISGEANQEMAITGRQRSILDRDRATPFGGTQAMLNGKPDGKGQGGRQQQRGNGQREGNDRGGPCTGGK